jgi:hypothetical protein
MDQLKRKIIPDEQCMVVLDTNPVRNIAHASQTPRWVATFAEMSKDGYSFCLADGAFTELLAQYYRTGIKAHEYSRMVQAIDSFISPDLPVLPGRKDLMGMIGESDGESDDPDWCEDELVAYSRHAMAVLKDPSLLPVEDRAKIEPALQDDRDEWIDWFAQFDRGYARWIAEEPEREKGTLDQYKHDLLDEEFADLAARGRSSHPTLAMRLDLQVRYLWRQWVRTRQEKGGYDPTTEKKVNDGIDFDLYRYLMLPAFVVSEDGGFHGSIKDIKSPQRDWFVRPQELADAWTRGERPRPAWVAPLTESQQTQNAG